jgi:Cdc6-like AAA superfamily ATPase
LDEVDQLRDFDVLYTLARNGFGLILAFTHYHALMHLPTRIRSSLALTEIEFPTYKSDENNLRNTWKEEENDFRRAL